MKTRKVLFNISVLVFSVQTLSYSQINQIREGGVNFEIRSMGVGVAEAWRPAIVSTAPSQDRLDIFVRSADNAIHYRWFGGNPWVGSPWQSLGGVVTSDPAAVALGPELAYVFARGTDNALYYKWLSGNAQPDWQSLGGVLTSGPAACSTGPNRLDVFVRGTDNAVYYKWFDSTNWSDWHSLGGVATSDPTAMAIGGAAWVFVRGVDNAIYWRWVRSGTPANSSGWQRLDGTWTSAPAVCSVDPDHDVFDVFARGTDNALWYNRFTGKAWSGWQSLGGVLASAPSAIAMNGASWVVVRGTDDTLYFMWLRSSSDHSQWQPLEGSPLPRLRGFAEIHNHQFANLAFGGKVVAGEAFGPMDRVLSASLDRGMHGPEHIRNIVGDLLEERGVGLPPKKVYSNDGYPSFSDWPNYREVTHQKVHEEWLYRAVQGGLRLMVMMAVDSPVLCGLVHGDGRNCEDEMSSIDLQLDAAYAMQAYLDDKAGGPGKGWYRIVKTPAEARQVVQEGKLAVVLGIETAHIFGCKKGMNCDWGQALEKYWNKGVRHFFPIHQDDNAFGGASYFQPILQRPINWVGDAPKIGLEIAGAYDIHTQPCPEYEFSGHLLKPTGDSDGRCNSLGLTPEGKSLINALIKLGAIIDVDHMSDKAFSQTLSIAEGHGYPVVASHAGFNQINNKDQNHEGQLTLTELKRIQNVGGMVGLIAWQGGLENVDTWHRPGKHEVAHICGETSETFAQAFYYALDNAPGMPLAIGTDMNTPGIRQPGPRFTNSSSGISYRCSGDRGGRLAYPFLARASNNILLDKCVSGTRTFDYNFDGLAHIGLLPDFVADLEALGIPPQDLEPLFNSAEGYIRLWEKAFGISQNLSGSGFPPTPSTWAEKSSGTFFTKDNDQVNYVIEPNQVGVDEVEFVIEIPEKITWQKEIVIKADDGVWTIGVQDKKKVDRNGLYRYQLPNAELKFRKKKGLFQGLQMQEVLKLHQLDKLPSGSRVTFTWVRD